jgi:uncharacterized protein (DUF1684 family)
MRRSLLLLLLAGCAAESPEARGTAAFDTLAWRQETEQWIALRDASVASAMGPIAQTGLCRLEDTRLPALVGGDTASACRLAGPAAPAVLGRLVRAHDTLRLEPAVPVFWVGEKSIRESATLAVRDRPEIDGAAAWHAAYRLTARWDGPNVTVWITDTLAAARQSFAGISRWPLDPRWRVEARFEPADDEWRRVATVRGFELPRQVAGQVVAMIGGEQRRLTAYAKGRGARSMLVVFRDATTGEESYPAGRFLDVPFADSSGHTVLDFNLARNPDCAFTSASPCPLPPRENWFTQRIEAGEQAYVKGGRIKGEG